MTGTTPRFRSATNRAPTSNDLPARIRAREVDGDADIPSRREKRRLERNLPLRNAVTIDPRIEVTVRKSPVHEGPREFGQPSGVVVETEVAILIDPLSSERPSRLTLFWEQYDSFKGAVHSYNEAVDRVAEPIGEVHAAYMDAVVFHGGPKWVKNLDAALARTTVNVAGGMLALGPNLVLLPEAIIRAPESILAGGSKIQKGVSEGHYDYAAKGVAEVCGGVGVLASLAVPIAGIPSTASAPSSSSTIRPRSASPSGSRR